MNRFDEHLQPGSFTRVLIGAGLTLFFAVYAFLEPGRRTFSLFLVVLGLIGTWHYYRQWRRKKDQRGLDLIDS